MSFFKKKLTEQDVATYFIVNTIKEARDAWPFVYKELNDRFDQKFIIEDEKQAAFDLTLASIAWDMQSLKNLFPRDRAERIEKWVFELLYSEDLGEYAAQEVKEYNEEYKKELQNIDEGGDPLTVIPARLIKRWLGKNIKNFNTESSKKKIGTINPLLVAIVTSMLVTVLGGTCKVIKDNFKITEGDIPPEEVQKLKKTPGGIGISNPRVLIKGPWEGVREGDPALFPDLISNSNQEDGCLYLACYYEKGKPQYYIVAKKVWESLDEIKAITANPGLSKSQQRAEIGKIVNKSQ